MKRTLVFVFLMSILEVFAQIEGADFIRMNTVQFSIPKIRPTDLGITNMNNIANFHDFFAGATNLSQEIYLVDSMKIFLPRGVTLPKVHFTFDGDAIVEWTDENGAQVFKKILKATFMERAKESRKKKGMGGPKDIEIKALLDIQFIIPTERRFRASDPDVSIWEPRPHAVF